MQQFFLSCSLQWSCLLHSVSLILVPNLSLKQGAHFPSPFQNATLHLSHFASPPHPRQESGHRLFCHSIYGEPVSQFAVLGQDSKWQGQGQALKVRDNCCSCVRLCCIRHPCLWVELYPLVFFMIEVQHKIGRV